MFKKIWTLIFLLQIYVLCWAQKEDYFATEWNKIDKLKENDFSSKNRFFKIKSLLKEAKILKNQQYIIKGYYSLIKHQYSFDDYPYNQIDSIYAYLQSERLKSPEIVPEIFEFLETVILFEYRFTRNYLIYTQNKYDTTELISKMSLTQLDEMIFQRYLNLIKNKTAFNGYSNSKPISNFITQNHSNLKLELFDIIVWEILHNLNKISQLHYNRSTFKLTDPQLLSSYSNFINFPLESIECNTTKKTIEIFQKLIQQYQNSSNKELLAYTDYHRLVWINKFLISSDKTNLFINELEHQFQLFPQIELAAWFGLELGNIYYREGVKYHPFNNTEPQYELVKAAKYYEKVMNYFKDIKLSDHAASQYNEILKKSLEFVLHPYYLSPKKPILATITYKNISELNVNIYRLKNLDYPSLYQLHNALNNNIPISDSLLKELVYKKNYTLKNLKDHQKHSTDIIIDPLDRGDYYLEYIVENKKKGFIINISNLEYLVNQNEILIIDKKNSSPVKNAAVKFWKREWKSEQQKNMIALERTSTADENGLISLHDNQSSDFIEIVNGNDRMVHYLREDFDFNNYVPYTKTIFLLDKNEYHPGDTIKFKGISYTKNKYNNRVAEANKTIQVQLIDDDKNIIEEKTFTTNQFGSIAGNFKIPDSIPIRILGTNLLIKDKINNGSSQIKIIESFHPLLTTKINPIQLPYRLNDSIEVTGNVISFNGSPIKNTIVNYSVKRLIHRRRSDLYINKFEHIGWDKIISGTTQSNSEGHFSFQFHAIPPEKFTYENNYYSYEIEVYVLGVDKKTYTSIEYLRLDSQKYYVNFPFDTKIENKKLDQFPLSIKNSQFEPLTVYANLTLTKLQTPAGLFHKRYLNAPRIDVISIDSINFKKLFPHEIFFQEDNPAYWKEIEKPIYINFISRLDEHIDLSSYNLKEGWYKMEVNIPGEDQNDVRYFEVFSKTSSPIYYEISATKNKTDYQLGEEARVRYKTNLPQSQHLILSNLDASSKNKISIMKANSNFEKKINILEHPQQINITSVMDGRIYNNFQYLSTVKTQAPIDVKIINKSKVFNPGQEVTLETSISGNIDQYEIMILIHEYSLDPLELINTNELHNASNSSLLKHWRSHLKNSFSEYNIYRFTNNTTKYQLFDWDPLNISTPANRTITVYNRHYNLSRNNIILDNLKLLNEEPTLKNAGQRIITSKKAVYNDQSLYDIKREYEDINSSILFLPFLKPDLNGKVNISFMMPKKNTIWNCMIVAHDKDLNFVLLKEFLLSNSQIEEN